MTILNAPLVILRASFCTGLITGATVPGVWLVATTAAAVLVMLLLEPKVEGLGTVDEVVVVVLVVVVAASVVVEVVVVVGKVVVEVLEAVVVVVVEVSETGATGCVSCADGANCWGRCSGPLGSAFGDCGCGCGGDDGATVVDERINVCSRTCDWSRSKSFLTGRSLPLLPIWLN